MLLCAGELGSEFGEDSFEVLGGDALVGPLPEGLHKERELLCYLTSHPQRVNRIDVLYEAESYEVFSERVSSGETLED